MSVEDYLQDIRCLVGDKMLLDPVDLAKILDRTPTAIQRLISKKKLPFRFKKLDSRIQVVTRSVAEWFAAQEDLSIAPSSDSAEPTAAPARKRRTKAADTRGSTAAAISPPAMSPMAMQLLQMRHDAREPFARFVGALEDPAEKRFVRELYEELFFDKSGLASSYVVTCRWVALPGRKYRSSSTQQHYSDKQSAEWRTLSILQRCVRQRARPDVLLQVSLAQGLDVLFEATLEAGHLRIDSNAAGFELPGA